MKTRFFAVWIGFLCVCACGVNAKTADPRAAIPSTEIRSVHEVIFRDWIAADGVFRINCPCLRVDLWTTADMKGDQTVGKAYFFDKDRVPLSKFGTIPNANHADGAYGLPPLLKAHTDIDVYVPIETKDKAGKWRNVVLIFGDPDKLMVEVYPRRENLTWKDFDFPEKEKLQQQQAEAEDYKKKRSALPSIPNSFSGSNR